jgi:hypothetical protein
MRNFRIGTFTKYPKYSGCQIDKNEMAEACGDVNGRREMDTGFS